MEPVTRTSTGQHRRLDGDRPLAERIVAGDPDAAVHLLVEQCGAQLAYLGRRFGHDDLLGELYLHLRRDDWRVLRTWRGESTLRRWTVQVATRLCLQHARRRAGPGTAAVPLDLSVVADRPAPCSGADGDGPGGLGPEQIGALVDALLTQLSPRDRLLIVSHCLRGRPIQEVAAALNVTVNHAYTLKSRALDRLRRALDGRLRDG